MRVSWVALGRRGSAELLGILALRACLGLLACLVHLERMAPLVPQASTALRGRQVPMALTGSLVLLAPMAAQVHPARKVSLANPVLLARRARQARTAPWELQDRRELQASLGVLGRTVPLEARGSLARLARTVRLVLQGRQAPRARRASQDGVEPTAFQALLVSTVRRASQGLLDRQGQQGSRGRLAPQVPRAHQAWMAPLGRTALMALQGGAALPELQETPAWTAPRGRRVPLGSQARLASQGLLDQRVSQPTWRSSSWRWVRRRTPWVRS